MKPKPTVEPKAAGAIARAIAALPRRAAMAAEIASLRQQLAGKRPDRLAGAHADLKHTAAAILAATAEPVTPTDLERLARRAENSKTHWEAYQSALKRFRVQQQQAAARRVGDLQRQLEVIAPGPERTAFFRQHRSELGF